MKITDYTLGILFMNKTLRKFLAAAVGVIPMFAYAQAHSGHAGHTSEPPKANVPASASGMPHGSMDMPGMVHEARKAPAQGHDTMTMPMPQTDPGKGTSAMPGAMRDQLSASSSASDHNMNTMNHGDGDTNHGDMQMQGGPVPPGARDPDAYSDGYVRNAGKYGLPPSDALMMSDMHNFGSVNFDRFEYVQAGGEGWTAYDGEAWYGSTYNRTVIKAEGEVASGKLRASKTQLLWRHAVATFWDTELGARFDYGQGAPNRGWLAFGVKGLAPYWFEVDATAYIGPSGRTALGLKVKYDILLTQKLYLQPSVEMNFYGKDDERWGIGSGMADNTAGLRLKYEVTRQLVPYVGVEWSRKFGKTADYAKAAGDTKQEIRFVAGLSFRF